MVEYKVHPNETNAFIIAVFFAVIGYLVLIALFSLMLMSEAGLAVGFLLIFYILLIAAFLLFQKIILVGHIRGNGVRITRDQLPEVYDVYEKLVEKAELREEPGLYLMESGGILNAFATTFLFKNYVVIYADILEKAYEDGIDTVEFILAHDLCHVVRRHMLKKLLLLPAIFIPFLLQAYSRGCEYTCDAFGKAFSSSGAEDGLMILAAGKKLHRRINREEYIRNAAADHSFVSFFAEVFSTRPHLPKRLQEIRRLD
jgi:Zn-dependent protease with chaperone function